MIVNNAFFIFCDGNITTKICFLKLKKKKKTPDVIISILYFTCWTIASNDLRFYFSQKSLNFFHSSLGPSDQSQWSTQAPRPSAPPHPVQRGQYYQRLVAVNRQSLLLKVPCHIKLKANPSLGMHQMALIVSGNNQTFLTLSVLVCEFILSCYNFYVVCLCVQEMIVGKWTHVYEPVWDCMPAWIWLLNCMEALLSQTTNTPPN